MIEFDKQRIDLTLLRANLRVRYAECWQQLEDLYRFAQQPRTAEVRRPPLATTMLLELLNTLRGKVSFVPPLSRHLS